MSADYAVSRFNLTCPTGGQFHVCTTTTVPFLGCCTVDPCTAARDGACPLANLRSSSFNPDTYEDLPRQDCADAESIRIWYTCKFNNPPFVGCCASNACGEGLCAPADLRPAKLSGDEKLRALFLNPATTALPSVSTVVGPTASVSVVPNATGSMVPGLPVVEPKSGGLSVGAIVGIVIGVVALAAIVFGAYKFGGARKKKGKGLPEGAQYQQTGSRDDGQHGGGEGDMSLGHGLGIQSHYRDSTFSGSTTFSPPMTQHAAFATPYDAKSLTISSPEFGSHPSPGRHSMVSDIFSTTGTPYGNNFPAPYQHPQHQHSQHFQHPQHPQHAVVPAVELPVEATSAQELPADEPTSQMSPQYAQSELLSGYSTPQTATPLPSPRFPDEQGGGNGQGGGYGYGRL